MRTIVSIAALTLALTAGSARATASFAPRELGLGVGAFALVPAGTISWGLPVTLEGGYYLESGWDLYLRVPLMFLSQNTGTGPTTVLATGGQFGVRYLFMEESIRPYIMLQLAGLYIFRDASQGNNFFAGPGTGAGVDFFVAESISIGVRATVDLYLTINPPAGTQALLFNLGGGVNVATYF